MTYDKLLCIFESWGFKLKTEHYWDFKQYFQIMLRRNRVITVMDNNEILAIIFFFITNDYVRLYKKSEFATPDDTVGGFQVYIDKMLCRKWTPKIRKLVQHELETNFPYLSEAVYHRAPNDRCVKLYRRRQLCMK